jgi:CTP synthase
LVFHQEGLDTIIGKKLKLKTISPNLRSWKKMVDCIYHSKKEVSIALIGKYVGLKDSYKSLYESLIHGGIGNKVNVHIEWIDSELLEKSPVESVLKGCHGVLVAGGFGTRGTEGKIAAIQYARLRQIPFLGICLGMQCAVIEIARNIAGLKSANSTEFDPKTPYPVIDLMYDQRNSEEKGGTMRLGAYPCQIAKGTLAYKAYRNIEVSERHRHRYEVNNFYRETLSKSGLIFSGLSPDKKLVELIEIADHPWFLAVQFHPEFQSRPEDPHPLFREFIKASLGYSEKGRS